MQVWQAEYFYCYNHLVDAVLIVRYAIDGMCAKSTTYMYVLQTSNNRVISSSHLYCCHSVKLCVLLIAKLPFPLDITDC